MQRITDIVVTVHDAPLDIASQLTYALLTIAGEGALADPHDEFAHFLRHGQGGTGVPSVALCGKKWTPSVVGNEARIERADCPYCYAVMDICQVFDLATRDISTHRIDNTLIPQAEETS